MRINDPQLPAKGCVIWMHGLGADASDMQGLATQPPIAALPLRHVFLDAPVKSITLNGGMLMRAWYDITGMDLTNREDKVGISQSSKYINDVINTQLSAGFKANQIFLAGFSQGAAMALYTAVNNELPLAGIIFLSGYLPLSADCTAMLAKETPIFLASGKYDPVVLPAWTHLSQEWLTANGYNQITTRQYPMEHSICAEEIIDIATWLKPIVEGVKAV